MGYLSNTMIRGCVYAHVVYPQVMTIQNRLKGDSSHDEAMDFYVPISDKQVSVLCGPSELV